MCYGRAWSAAPQPPQNAAVACFAPKLEQQDTASHTLTVYMRVWVGACACSFLPCWVYYAVLQVRVLSDGPDEPTGLPRGRRHGGLGERREGHMRGGRGKEGEYEGEYKLALAHA